MLIAFFRRTERFGSAGLALNAHLVPGIQRMYFQFSAE
jgi:hypothetical protein